jgi:hypothetical protein
MAFEIQSGATEFAGLAMMHPARIKMAIDSNL